jgi:hypothetical protein
MAKAMPNRQRVSETLINSAKRENKDLGINKKVFRSALI